MTDPISPIGGASGLRGPSRRATADEDDQAEAGAPEAPTAAQLPAPIAPTTVYREPPRSRRAALAAFAAQLLGQGGQKRGLRGGPETLDKARAAYLETEWSGPSDRRLRRGGITKTEV